MPQSATALVAALALVPGYFYLWLTDEVRKPSAQRPLAELLQVVLVGAATTGPACACLALVLPRRVLAALSVVQSSPSEVTSASLRSAVWLSIVLVALALALACGLAKVTRKAVKKTYSPSVMQGTLGQTKSDHGRFVGVTLQDGSTIDGLLHAYSLHDQDDARVIALRKPIRRHSGGAIRELPFDYFMAFGSDIKGVVVQHSPRAAAPVPATGQGAPKGRGGKSGRRA